MSLSKFQIWIKDNEGNRTQLKVTKDMKIRQIKELYIQTNPDLKDYKTLELFFRGDQLDNDKTLEQLKIKSGKTLSLLSLDELIDAAIDNHLLKYSKK